jgi:hypothetical protein
MISSNAFAGLLLKINRIFGCFFNVRKFDLQRIVNQSTAKYSGNPIYPKSFTRRFHGDQKEKNDSSSSLPIDPLLIPDFFGNNVNPLAYIFVKSIPN